MISKDFDKSIETSPNILKFVIVQPHDTCKHKLMMNVIKALAYSYF